VTGNSTAYKVLRLRLRLRGVTNNSTIQQFSNSTEYIGYGSKVKGQKVKVEVERGD